MNRIVVAGARGFFGANVVRLLREEGCGPLLASRRPGLDVVLDVEDRASIRRVIRAGDVIVDATAPFQRRTTLLVDEAIEIGADVVDLSDSLAYSRLVFQRDAEARDHNVRLMTACSSVSVLSALAIAESGIRNPVAIHGFLAPETSQTANPGAAQSLLNSVGQRIKVWREGEMQDVKGWSESRNFHFLEQRGRLMEMADAFTLPQIHASLREVDFWVNPNVFGASALLKIVANNSWLLPTASWFIPYAGHVARMLGSNSGVLAYEIEGENGNRSTVVFSGPKSFLMAALPAALAAKRLASGKFCLPGVVPAHQQVDWNELKAALAAHGLNIRVHSI